MQNDRIIAFVMAGGQGSRLQPLTTGRSKPSVPFGSRYRIVDFVLSNLVNSQIQTIYLLVQYKSQSLIEHVRKAWTISPLLQNQFVTVVPPQMMSGEHWFQGTADAVNQNINLIEEHRPGIWSRCSAPTTSIAWTSARWSISIASVRPMSPSPPCPCRCARLPASA
jgi:glucose-1-phosphate adenylyltransferase